MDNKKCIEIYTPNNILLFKVFFVENQIPMNNNGNGNGSSTENSTKKKNREDFITDPQIRMLFRLMAFEGFEGDKATERLKSVFKVDVIKEISKYNASKKIEQLLEEQKEVN